MSFLQKVRAAVFGGRKRVGGLAVCAALPPALFIVDPV